MIEVGTLLLIIILALVAIGLFVAWAIYRQRNRSIDGEAPYHWQPEQDFDVEIKGESAMQPGFPTLVPKDKKPKDR